MLLGTSLRVCLTTAVFATMFASPTLATSDNSAKPHRVHHARTQHAAYRPHRMVEAGSLPYRPEYGFLDHVPPNAIRMPGYTFVPGVGILGESCDLPTSACSNRYRDVQ